MPRIPRLRTAFLALFVLTSLSLCSYAQQKTQTGTTPNSQSALGITFISERAPLNLPGQIKTSELVSGAAVVDYMYPNSPALAAGVKNGDVVLAIAGKRLCGTSQAGPILSAFQPGAEIELILFRDGALKSFKVQVSSWSQLYPNLDFVNSLRPQIDQAAQSGNYKIAKNLCKKIPEEQQIEASLSCIDASRNTWDYKGLRKAVEALSLRCQNCLKSAFAHSWELAPNTDAGINANSAVTGMVARYRQAEMNLFRKLDQDYWNSISALPPDELLTKYENMAHVEGMCRDVPPSPVLVEGMIHFAKQHGTAVIETARKKAEEAKSLEKSAKDPPGVYAAARKWNETIWLAPWWSEPYVRSSALFDKLGRPQEAAEISKLALMIPTATNSDPVVTAAVATPLAPAPDDGPASPEALERCASALSNTEKGGDAEANTRQRCARIAGKLEARPPVSETAQRYLARGEAALELGQSPAEFLDAATEFENALRLAPWWAEAFCGLGQANEKAARLQQAILAYKGCIAAAPKAATVPEIQKRIYKLEYAADREQRQAITAQMQQRETDLRLKALEGVWINKSTGNPYRAVIQDGLFVASRTPPSDRYNKYHGDYVIKGRILGEKIEGTFTDPPLYNTGNGCTTPQSELSLNGTISPDGKMMTVKYQSATFQTNGIRGNLFNLPRCTFLQKIGEQTVMMILQKQD